VLEITESVMIADVELAIQRLSALRELGVQVAVDDFGTGYSSLDYIRRLPIDILKIDKRFIDSVDATDKDGQLSVAIIGLARVLDLRCIAEASSGPRSTSGSRSSTVTTRRASCWPADGPDALRTFWRGASGTAL